MMTSSQVIARLQKALDLVREKYNHTQNIKDIKEYELDIMAYEMAIETIKDKRNKQKIFS